MRVRKKLWARPELEASGLVITDPFRNKGKWSLVFGNSNPVHLELGCGTGRFISENAVKNPDINYIGIDVKDEILVYAKRNIERIVLKTLNKNLFLIPMNVEQIDEVFESGEISKIYINFCNPWPKARQNKRRLTHSLFLQKYKTFLKPGSEIWFKTDDELLFEDSIEYFKQSGFRIDYITKDLHQSDFKHNIITEYELNFINKGLPIMFLIAVLE